MFARRTVPAAVPLLFHNPSLASKNKVPFTFVS